MATYIILALIAGFFLFMVFGCTRSDPPVVEPPKPSNPIRAFQPFIVGSSQTMRSPLAIDVRYLPHGCGGGGEPIWYTGAFHEDGAPMEYRYECDWSVFNAKGEKLNSRWTSDAVVNLWVGWTSDRPLLPPIPQSCSGTPVADFTYYARDVRGNVASYTVRLGVQ